MKNQTTGKSRGFGFVTFRDPQCVETVLLSGPHVLDGRQVRMLEVNSLWRLICYKFARFYFFGPSPARRVVDVAAGHCYSVAR